MKKTAILIYSLFVLSNTLLAQNKNHSLTYSKADSLTNLKMDKDKFWKRMKNDSIKNIKSKTTFTKNNLSGITPANSKTIKSKIINNKPNYLLLGIAITGIIILLLYLIKRKNNERKNN